MVTFVEYALAGKFEDLDEAIDDCVDEWHNGAGENLELHEYLGFTWEEYAIWVPHPSELVNILEARRQK